MSKVDLIVSGAEELIAVATTLDQLEEVESQLVGRRSELAELRRTLGSRPAEERRALGGEINEAQRRVEDLVGARRKELDAEAEDRLLASDRADITLPAVELVRGTHHLITQSMAEICEIFRAIGYQVVTGPEVETVRYNFDALNHVPHHPARLPSDTLYLEPWDGRGRTGEEALLLRTHTSPMQARVMERQPPPVYVVVPGRTYRPDPWDATHAPVFHQVEGLAVAEDITFGDLKGTLEHFAREMFRADREDEVQPRLLSFHRAVGADGGELARRLARAARLRDGGSQRVRGCRVRPDAGLGIRLWRRCRPGRHGAPRHR